MQILKTKKAWIFTSLLLIVLTHLPTSWSGLHYDDFLLWGQLQGSQPLADKGFKLTDPQRPLANKLGDAFHFYSESKGTVQFYREYGSLPWWSSEKATMNPLRPVAAFTHYLDFAVFDSNELWIGMINLVSILLLWVSAYLLFFRLHPSVPLACLAAFLVTIDFSVTANFHWLAARNSYIATALGAFALLSFIRWREDERLLWLISSVCIYTIGLLTAEASIALLAYLGAYALFKDKKGWFWGGLSTLPFVLITVGWRLSYNSLGLGADHIGLYADPGNDLTAFFYQLFTVFPSIALSLIVGSDELTANFNPEIRHLVAMGAWAVVILLIFPIRRLLLADKNVRFMFVGSIVSIVPFATLLITSSRSATFSALGFFYILAVWLVSLWNESGRFKFRRVLAVIVAGWHLALPALVAVFVSIKLVSVSMLEDTLYKAVDSSTTGDPGRAIVLVNHPVPTHFFYLPFTWEYYGRHLPNRLNALAPGLSTITVERLSKVEFMVVSKGPMAVNHKVKLDGSDGKIMHQAFAYQLLEGLFTSPKQRYSVDGAWFAGDLKVTPIDIVDGVPVSVRVKFDTAGDPDGMAWVYYDWEERMYHSMKVLDVGEKITIPGPFDIL